MLLTSSRKQLVFSSMLQFQVWSFTEINNYSSTIVGNFLVCFFFLDFKPVQCIVMDSLEASDRGANHTSPGDAEWHRTLVRACLECQFHQTWPKGEYLNRTVCNSSLFSDY